MSIIFYSVLVFTVAYLINMFTTSILYHRMLAHRSLESQPWLKNWVVKYGPWITGIDVKAWCCMHRLHHLYSDTARDPHSPKQLGVFGVLKGQLKSYKRVIGRLRKQDPELVSLCIDLDFELSWLTQKWLWLLPYYLHLFIGLAFFAASGSITLAFAYILGILSHPIQGWIVNSVGHRYGSTRYALGDQSKNNTLVSLLILGEGYQNNHHKSPSNPNFAHGPWEFDFGFTLCKWCSKMGLIQLPKQATRPQIIQHELNLSPPI